MAAAAAVPARLTIHLRSPLIFCPGSFCDHDHNGPSLYPVWRARAIARWLAPTRRAKRRTFLVRLFSAVASASIVAGAPVAADAFRLVRSAIALGSTIASQSPIFMSGGLT